MGHLLQIPQWLGLFLVIIRIQTAITQADGGEMRMASDSLIIPDYKKDGESDLASSIITLSDDNTEYQIYQGVMGRPGVDFPVHPHIPATSFTCRDIKRSGYYADLETDCQVFHICDGGRKISFICPNGTIFRQSHLICDWWFRVDCGKSVELYEESAEQLAADQKLFQERAEERERRRKLVKTLRGEAYKPDIFSLQESRNNGPLPTLPTLFTTTRPLVVERKPERHSKRVLDAHFTDFYPNQGNYVTQAPTEIIHSEKTAKLSGAQERKTTNINSITPIPTKASPSYSKTSSPPDLKPREKSPPFATRIQHILAVDKHLLTKSVLKSETSHEVEKQHLAESASFASHRNGRFYQNFVSQNQQNFLPTTSTFAPSYKTIQTDKKLEDRLKYVTYPTTHSPIYKPTIPTIKTTSALTTYSSSRIPIDNIYFTTKEPEVIESKSINSDNSSSSMKSFNPDVAISLQELNINKGSPDLTPTPNSLYESSTREGLDIPPSSGPTSLRSFALYFAGPDEIPRTKIRRPYFTNNVLVIPISKEQEQKLSGKNTIKEVDNIVNNSNNLTAAIPTSVTSNVTSVPSSLTQKTRDSFSEIFGNNTRPTESDITIIQSSTETIIEKNQTKPDLVESQSRGIVEPDIDTNKITDKVTPNLRELAQIFTKALSAYLDDPEGFRRVLSEIRPTEPSTSDSSAKPVDYPSATQEEDEVLDFSDVTKAPNKKKVTTALNYETTTEIETQTTTINNAIEDVVLPLSADVKTNVSQQAPSLELIAPYLETLDQSQSNYYTPSPALVATTNAIAEEINKEFSQENIPEAENETTEDSYLPVSGSVNDLSRPRYGGFQNNSKYSPYGSELTTRQPELPITTFNPSKNRTQNLYNKLNLIVNQARQERRLKLNKESPSQVQHQAIKLGNGETLERTVVRTTPRVYLTTALPVQFEANPEEINLELSPPAQDLKGFYITQTWSNDPVTTVNDFETTTIPERPTTHIYVTETYPPPTVFEPVRTTTTEPPTTTEYITTTASLLSKQTTTNTNLEKTDKPFERLMELQETLMFNSSNTSQQQKKKAREMVEETMKNITMSDLTANTLMQMMELAAKNETYRRLVLLLVNDRSGKNKTVEEARISLLKALLTPVINQGSRYNSPSNTRSRSFRRGKVLVSTTTEIPRTTQSRRVTTADPERYQKKSTVRPRIVMTTPSTTTTTVPSTTTTQKLSTVIGNLGLIKKTIENSRTKEIRVNSLDDAILDSDSRAIELLRSLYSLAARWG